jgi:selenium-binding protein 1
MWYREDGGKQGKWAIRKVIEIPAEPADPEKLPPLLQGFKAVPPLVTDINLSLDDRFLYVSCFGTGEFIQYDVSDPANPKKTGSIHLGGIVRRASAATASASISPTRFTLPGTSSSIPME